MRQVEEVETPTKQTQAAEAGIEPATNKIENAGSVAVSTPRRRRRARRSARRLPAGVLARSSGRPTRQFPAGRDASAVAATRRRLALAAVVEEAEHAIDANADAATRERIVAKALAEMTPRSAPPRAPRRPRDGRAISRRRSSRRVRDGSGSNSGGERPAAPTWSEKPAPGRVPTLFDGGPAAAREAEDAALASSDPDSRSPSNFWANAAELTFRALHPNAPVAPREPRANAGAAAAPSTRAEAAREGGEIDPADPEAATKAKEVLECQFFGANADELASRRVPRRRFAHQGRPSRVLTRWRNRCRGGCRRKRRALRTRQRVGGSVRGVHRRQRARADVLALHPDAAPPAEGTWATEEEVAATAGALPTTPGHDEGDGAEAGVEDGAGRRHPSTPPFAPLDEPLSEAQERAWASAEVSAPDVPAAAAAAGLQEGADSMHEGVDSVGTAAHPAVVAANAQDASRLASAAFEMDAASAGLAEAADALLAGDADAAARVAETEGEAGVRVPVSMDSDTGATVPTDSSRDPTKGWTPPTVSDETLRKADDDATREWDFDDIVARGEELVDEAGAGGV